MSTRAERVAAVQRLRRDGLTIIEVAESLGVSRSYVSALLYDPDRSKELARRASYAGACEVCGAPTDGSNGRAGAPRYCQAHIGANEEWIASRTKWTRDLIVVRIREWAELHGEPPSVLDWSPYDARRVNDESRATRFERAAGYWPWFMSVVDRFGSWNAGIVAAGFEPRAVGGTRENQRRRRNVRAAA